MKRASLLLLALCACTETRNALEGTQSIEVEMVSPASPGTVDQRLTDAQRTITVNLRAKDADGNLDTSFSASLRVYAQFLGTLTPALSAQPLATVQMTNGVAMATIELKSTFGPTTLWIDNGEGIGPDYQFGEVAGTSPTLWYRDPFVVDLQRPPCDATTPPSCAMQLDALSSGPLNDKQVRVGTSRNGATGALVVTSVFAQGYTVSDVSCVAGGEQPMPPCTTPPQDNGVVGYDHAMVFTFSAPRDQYGRPIVEGEVIQAFNGGVSEFNGLTEIGFPRTFISAPNRDTPPHVNRALMPAPVQFIAAGQTTSWFSNTNAAADQKNQGKINFERSEAGPIEILNAKVCPLDDGPDGVYTKYKQWNVAPAKPDLTPGDCNGDVINLITAGTDFTTDPHTLVGKTLPKVIGILRPVNIGSFNVWIVYPRGKDDLQTQ
jgi:hypothetical protein